MIGYRDESYGGSGVRDAAEVVMFEIFELGNTDILSYCLPQLPTSPFVHAAKKIEWEIGEYGYVNDMSERAQRGFAIRLLREMSELDGVEIKYALWLTSKKAALKYYGGNPLPYETGPVVLSDLGYEGRLFGYAKYPIVKA